MREKDNKNRGITLIALVVTIVVLLILAGISISMLTGQNGILNRAAEAKEKTAKAQEEEFATLNDYEEMIGKYTSNLPSTEYTAPYLPDSNKFERVEGTNLSNGLVIREKATGSEYVWVEVPRTTTAYQTAGLDITEFTDTDYNNIEKDLHQYTNDYRDGTDYSDSFYDASDDENEAYKSDWFQSEEDYNKAKKKMLKSIYKNGGFWVGRYEAGIEKNRIEKGDAATVPLSKANLYPYNYVTRTQAKVLAEKIESGSYTSSLMFGVQWDLVLKYIESKNATTQTNLKTDSKIIGNYSENLWNITNENAKYSTDKGKNFTVCPYKKQTDADILLTTGADTSFSLMNIYDVAGNVWEWTKEFYDTIIPCVYRGGTHIGDGSSFPAKSRNGGDVSTSYPSVGFRLGLWK